MGPAPSCSSSAKATVPGVLALVFPKATTHFAAAWLMPRGTGAHELPFGAVRATGIAGSKKTNAESSPFGTRAQAGDLGPRIAMAREDFSLPGPALVAPGGTVRQPLNLGGSSAISALPADQVPCPGIPSSAKIGDLAWSAVEEVGGVGT